MQGAAVPFVSTWIERRRVLPRDPGEMIAFCGRWSGSVEDQLREDGQVGRKNDTLTMVIEKKKGVNLLIGTFEFKDDETGVLVRGNLDNGIVRHRHATFHYSNVDPTVLHHGGLVLRLDPSSTGLRGYHSGVTSKSGTLVNGEILLSKIPVT